MEMQSTSSSRLKVIQHDCSLIMEAIRRLIEGTWELTADDQSYSWELFPKVRDSLLEHVHFEEESLFPTLSTEDREAHRADHRLLLAQLWSVERALVESRGEFFQEMLRGLELMLKEHHLQFSQTLGAAGGLCCSSCHAEEQIKDRFEKRTL